MDRLEAMSLLLKVVDTGSMTAASRALGMPLASLSRKLGELESHLGTRLLERTTRSLALSEAGAAYAATARRILDEVAAQEAQAAGLFQSPRGVLHLTAPMLFGHLHVLPVVSRFIERYPAVDVQLQLSDRNLHFVEEGVDAALRIGPLADSAMTARRLGQMRSVVCASPGWIARHGRPDRPEALSLLPAVHFNVFNVQPVWPFRDPATGRSLEIAVSARLCVNSAAAALAAAIEGLGVTRLLHYQCAAPLARGELEILLEAYELSPLPVRLLHAGNPPAAKTRAFLDFATPLLRARIAAIAG